jgi:pimeloyl-ACP methyl ester carboxylesterase
MNKAIPFVDFGGSGEIIHFAHANGFPPETYRQFIGNLTPDYRVTGMKFRPLWPNSDPHAFRHWETAADDLIQFLDQQGLSNIIGIGHSFGGIATLLASIKRPNLFKQLVLIEPVVLPGWVYVMTKLLPRFLLVKANPVVKKTLVRTEQWDNRKQAFRQFRSKQVFSKIKDNALWDYVNAATHENPDESVSLTFSKDWEAQIYMTFSSQWKNLDNVTVPYLAIRGESSDTISKAVWAKWKSRNRIGEFFEVENTGHLIPLEKPVLLTKIIKEYLSK